MERSSCSQLNCWCNAQSHVLSLFPAAMLGNKSQQRDQRGAGTEKSLVLLDGEVGTITGAATYREDNKKPWRWASSDLSIDQHVANSIQLPLPKYSTKMYHPHTDHFLAQRTSKAEKSQSCLVFWTYLQKGKSSFKTRVLLLRCRCCRQDGHSAATHGSLKRWLCRQVAPGSPRLAPDLSQMSILRKKEGFCSQLTA